jgi:hypothetical protein
MGRSRARLASDWFAKLRQNAVTNAVEHIDVTDVASDVTAVFSDVVTNAYRETVFAVTGTTPALDPANGSVQTWTLSGASTPTDGFSSGESMTLMIDDGAAYAITWPTMQWAGGEAPTLATTGYSVIVLWKVGATLYGASAGDMA